MLDGGSCLLKTGVLVGTFTESVGPLTPENLRRALSRLEIGPIVDLLALTDSA